MTTIFWADPLARSRRLLGGWLGLRAQRDENQVGGLDVYLPLDGVPDGLLRRDARIEVWYNGRLLGDTIWFLRRWRPVVYNGAAALHLRAYDPLYLLRGRIVDYPAGSDEAQKSGAADTLLVAFVNENLASGAADPLRIAPLITVAAAGGVCPTTYLTAPKRNLLTVCRILAAASMHAGVPLLFDFVVLPDGRLQFTTWPNARGVDRRRGGLGTLRLVPDGNLPLDAAAQDTDYSDEITAVVAAGQGLEEQRLVVRSTDAARLNDSPYGRREMYLDARYLSSTDRLAALANATLQQNAPVRRVSGGVDAAGFGVAWGYGDLVETEIAGDRFDGRIVGFVFAQTGTATPVLTVMADEATAVVSALTINEQLEALGLSEAPIISYYPVPFGVPQANADSAINLNWFPSELKTFDSFRVRGLADAFFEYSGDLDLVFYPQLERTFLAGFGYDGDLAPDLHFRALEAADLPFVFSLSPGAGAVPLGDGDGRLHEGWLPESAMLASVYDTDVDGIVDAAESVPWSGVMGKPSTFAPSAHTHTLAELRQSSAASGQFVRWNGSAWVAAFVAAGDLPTHQHALADLLQGSATSGMFVRWSGSAWVPALLVAGDLPSAAVVGGGSGAANRIPIFSDNRTLMSNAALSFDGTWMLLQGKFAVGSNTTADPYPLMYFNKAGQAAFDLHNTTTGGTPSSGSRWRIFVDNVGGGGGTVTFGFYDVANARLSFGVENDGTVVADYGVRASAFRVGANQVVGARGAAVADATATVASVQTQLNALLARLRAHGLIAP